MRSLTVGVIPLLAGGLAMLACNREPDAPAAAGGTIDDLPILRLVEEFRIGSVHDPDVGFTQIGAVRRGPDGHLYVAERRDRQLRVYDEDGTLLRTFGRAGEGPGEFAQISRFGFQGDTLWIGDGSRARVTLFSRSTGALLGTVTGRLEVELPPPRPGPAGLPPVASTGGGQHVYLSHLRPDGTYGSSAQSTISTALMDTVAAFPIVRFDAGGNVLDTLEVQQLRVSFSVREVELQSRPFPTTVRLDPPPNEHTRLGVEFDEDRIDVDWRIPTSASDAVFQLTRVGSGGDTVYHRTFRYAPIPVSDEYLDRMARGGMSSNLSPRDSQTLFEARRAGLRMPPFHPPIVTLEAVGEGVPWILLQDPHWPWAGVQAPEQETYRWLVLDPEGRELGTLELPSSASPRWMEEDLVWVSEPDQFGVPWLVRYRLRADAG